MKFGDIDVHVISDGTFKLDAGAIFGVVPKTLWQRKVKADRRNRLQMGLNCMLIHSNGHNILVDTGVGKKESDRDKDIYGISAGKILRRLKEHGLGPRDIDLVVLSHLHFDHVGGCTRFNSKGEVVPTFPKAKYWSSAPTGKRPHTPTNATGPPTTPTISNHSSLTNSLSCLMVTPRLKKASMPS